MTSDLVNELIDNFAYIDLFSNSLVHRAAEEIVSLRSRVKELEAEVSRLEKIAYI